MEKIYTIPVNEAFDAAGGCPFCRMKKKLNEHEVELILGASMMEPDVRIQTNEKGFCSAHYSAMFRAQKRLPLALMLESHLDVIAKACRTPRVSLKEKTGAVAEKYAAYSSRCYVCDRVEFHWSKMFETACLLWEADPDFRKKFAAAESFCMPCYTRLLETARLEISKKRLADFLDAAQEVETGYLDSLRGDISHFCKKFDYRYQDEPWGNSRDAVERALRFLRGADTLPAEEEKKKP